MIRTTYDALAPTYAAWADRVQPDLRVSLAARVLEEIPSDSVVVELGCGPGVPIGAMVQRRCRYIGVDLSGAMLREARTALASAMLVQADMTSLALRSESIDAVLAFFSLFHVPREHHRTVVSSVAAWLRPGGLIAAIVAYSDEPTGYEDDWLGAGPMFWSSHDRRGAEDPFTQVGLHILEASTHHIVEDDDDGDVLCLLARR
jgi:SAM-dependent methyltransferase